MHVVGPQACLVRRKNVTTHTEEEKKMPSNFQVIMPFVLTFFCVLFSACVYYYDFFPCCYCYCYGYYYSIFRYFAFKYMYIYIVWWRNRLAQPGRYAVVGTGACKALPWDKHSCILWCTSHALEHGSISVERFRTVLRENSGIVQMSQSTMLFSHLFLTPTLAFKTVSCQAMVIDTERSWIIGTMPFGIHQNGFSAHDWPIPWDESGKM